MSIRRTISCWPFPLYFPAPARWIPCRSACASALAPAWEVTAVPVPCPSTPTDRPAVCRVYLHRRRKRRERPASLPGRPHAGEERGYRRASGGRGVRPDFPWASGAAPSPPVSGHPAVPSGESARITPSRFQSSTTIRYIFTQSAIYVTTIPLDPQSGAQMLFLRFLPRVRSLADHCHHRHPGGRCFMTCGCPPGGLSGKHLFSALPHRCRPSPARSSSCRPSTHRLRLPQFQSLPGSQPGLHPHHIHQAGSGCTGCRTHRTAAGRKVPGALRHQSGRRPRARAAALFFEWAIIRQKCPSLNGLGVKNFFIRSARRSIDLTYPNREWGYGILNLYHTFSHCFKKREGMPLSLPSLLLLVWITFAFYLSIPAWMRIRLLMISADSS